MREMTTMSRKENRAPVDRRGFLKVLGSSTAVAATAVAPGMVGEAEAMNPGREETRARYKETDHVKAYYRTNRY
jgi:hypothetical protein